MEVRTCLHGYPGRGASVAGLALFAVASGMHGFDPATSGFASNGYAGRSPDGYSILATLLAEIILFAIFLFVILGSPRQACPQGFGRRLHRLVPDPVPLGLEPITNTSVNPARSLDMAWFSGPAL